MVTHQWASANRRFRIGLPDFGGQPHIARLFCGNVSYPKPFREPKRHLTMYGCTSFILWNRRLSPLWRPSLPFGVYYSCTLTPYYMPAEGINPTGAYIKLRKNPRNSKRREKIWVKFWRFTPYSASRIMAVRKKFCREMLKTQPCFREIRWKTMKSEHKSQSYQ